jgi:hypothetical protein
LEGHRLRLVSIRFGDSKVGFIKKHLLLLIDFEIRTKKPTSTSDFMAQSKVYVVVVGYIISGLFGSSKTTRSPLWFLLMVTIQFYVAYTIYHAEAIKYDTWIKVVSSFNTLFQHQKAHQ